MMNREKRETRMNLEKGSAITSYIVRLLCLSI